MHGIVSLLPPPYDQEVRSIWKELEEDCGLIGIKITPYPHFSWQIAQDYDLEPIDRILKEMAANTPPFTIHTAGLGLFTGPRPVVFIHIVKSSPLIQFHETLCQRTAEFTTGASPYYNPQSWIPHISLAHEDVDATNISPVIEQLAFRAYAWEMQVDNIALIYQPAGEQGSLRYTYKFG